GIGVTQADAERLKERYGCAYEPLVDPQDIIQLPSTVAQGERHVPREVLAHIIHQRMDEIFNLVLAEIQRAGFAQRLSGGVVITGGAAAMQGVAELAGDVFGTGVRIGSPSENIGGLTDSVEAPRFSTVVGLALYGAHRSAAGFAPSGRHRAMAGAGVDRSPSGSKPGPRNSSCPPPTSSRRLDRGSRSPLVRPARVSSSAARSPGRCPLP